MVTAALSKNNLGRPENGERIPAVIYRFATSLDFSPVTLASDYPMQIDGFKFVGDARAIFYVSLTNAPAVNIKPPAGHKFRDARIVIGGVYDYADHSDVIGVRLEKSVIRGS